MLGDGSARRIYFLMELLKRDSAKAILSEDSLMTATTRESADLPAEQRIDDTFRRLEERIQTRNHLDLSRYYRALPTLPKWPFWVLCLCLGMASNYLGHGQAVNLLRVPILALILWNIGIVGISLLFSLLRRKPPGLPFSQSLYDLWLKKSVLGGSDDIRKLLCQAELGFRRRWLKLRGHRVASRVAIWLNLGAILIVVGAVLGMYLRGLSESYQFVWASTFIADEAQLRQILNLFFAPVLAFWPGGLPPLSGSNGAAWIHLFAATAGLYAILPRMALIFWHQAILKRTAKLKLDLQDPVFVAILSQHSNLEPNISLVGYSYQLNEARSERLMDLARLVWGHRARLFETIQIEWGDLDFDPDRAQKPPQIVLVCFNGAQTPEEEVHTEFARAMVRWETRHPSVRLLALIDFATIDAAKRIQRQDAWRDVLDHGGFRSSAFLDGHDLQNDAATLKSILESQTL